MVRPELIESIKLSMHGQPLAFEIDRSQPLFGLVTKLRRAEIAATDRDFGITIEVPVTRPFDLGLGEDRRWLGAAIAWVLVSPLKPAEHARPCAAGSPASHHNDDLTAAHPAWRRTHAHHLTNNSPYKSSVRRRASRRTAPSKAMRACSARSTRRATW